MVKVPKSPYAKKKRRLLFRDAQGRFVPESERYQKATQAFRWYRGRYVRIIDQAKPVSPKQLVNLVTQDEFEALQPAFGKTTTFVPQTKRKYKAWDVATQIAKEPPRGSRGKLARIEMVLRDGPRTRRITFYRKIRRRGDIRLGLFYGMNRALTQEGFYLYNRVGHKLIPDRLGREVKLMSVNLTPEL